MLRGLFCLLLIACAPRLTPGFEVEGGDFLSSDVYTLDADDGSRTTQIQATSKEDWVYFDFETESETSVDDPAWDLSFQRFKIVESEAAAVALLTDVAFADLTVAPSEGFTRDAINSGDSWYFYNLSNHTLASRNFTYVVRSTEGAFYKLTFVNYYDSTGSSGFPAFKWQKL